MNTIAGIH